MARPSTPTVLKELAGNPGKRALPKNEPKPSAVNSLAAPAHLTKEAREEWLRLAPELKRLNLLTTADVSALLTYCEAYATWRAAKREVKKYGLTFESQTKQRKKNPAVEIMDKAARTMNLLADRLGLNPSGRVKLGSTMAAGGAQPPLPGADAWPEAGDPAKPKVPARAEMDAGDDGFTDDEFFRRQRRAAGA